MHNMNNPKEYNELYVKYSNASDEQLEQIIASGNIISDDAKLAAYDVLQKRKYLSKDDPTHIALMNIANDIHYIKQTVSFFKIINIIGIIALIASVFK